MHLKIGTSKKFTFWGENAYQMFKPDKCEKRRNELKLNCKYKKCTGLCMATKSYTSFSHFHVLMFSCKCTLTKKASVFLYLCKLTNLNIKNMLKVQIS
jgi:hypothetical protein